MRVTVNLMAQRPGNPRNGGAAAVQAVCYCLAQCFLSILERVVQFVNLSIILNSRGVRLSGGP